MVLTQRILQCDQCETQSEPFDGAIFTPAMLRTEMRDDGWRRPLDHHQRDRRDLCPECVAVNKTARRGRL